MPLLKKYISISQELLHPTMADNSNHLIRRVCITAYPFANTPKTDDEDLRRTYRLTESGIEKLSPYYTLQELSKIKKSYTSNKLYNFLTSIRKHDFKNAKYEGKQLVQVGLRPIPAEELIPLKDKHGILFYPMIYRNNTKVYCNTSLNMFTFDRKSNTFKSYAIKGNTSLEQVTSSSGICLVIGGSIEGDTYYIYHRHAKRFLKKRIDYVSG